MAEVVQADYEALAGVAKRFATNASAIQQLQSRLGRQVTQLRSAWIGKGSDAFFAEMTDKVLPAVQRLNAALTEAERVTKQIDQLLRDAEEEGAAPFEQAEGGGSPGGEIGDAAGGGGSGDGLGDDFMRNLDEFTRQISIENPGSGEEGAWSEDSYRPGDMDGSGFDQIENDYGFGDAADLGGAGSSGGGSSDFAVPEDWLDGVTGDSPWSGNGAGGMGELGGAGSGSGGEMGAGSGSGGETGGGAGSGGMPTGSGSPADSGGMPAGAGAGQGGGAGGDAAAGRVPEPLRYQPLGSGVMAAPAAGSGAAAGMQAGHGGMVSGAAPAAAKGNLGIPTGLAALGPLVALLGKAIKDRTSK